MTVAGQRIEPKLRIGDKVLSEGSGGFYAHVNPANGKVQAQIPLAGTNEVNAAVEAAAQAFEVWKKWTGEQRRDALLRLADLVTANTEGFGLRAAMDIGTPIAMGAAGPHLFSTWTRYYAGWADKLAQVVGNANPVAGPFFNLSTPEPTGVVAVLAPEESSLLGLVSVIAPVIVSVASV